MFIFYSANAFDLDQSKILMFGKLLTLYNRIPNLNDLEEEALWKNWGKRRQEGHDGPGITHLSLLHCESKIWPSDLVFDRTWPIFILILEIVKASILTKFNEYLN